MCNQNSMSPILLAMFNVGGIIVSMFALNAVDCGFEPHDVGSNQTL